MCVDWTRILFKLFRYGIDNSFRSNIFRLNIFRTRRQRQAILFFLKLRKVRLSRKFFSFSFSYLHLVWFHSSTLVSPFLVNFTSTQDLGTPISAFIMLQKINLTEKLLKLGNLTHLKFYTVGSTALPIGCWWYLKILERCSNFVYYNLCYHSAKRLTHFK